MSAPRYEPQQQSAQYRYATVTAVAAGLCDLDFGDPEGELVTGVPVHGETPGVGERVMVLLQGRGATVLPAASGPGFKFATGTATTGVITAPTDRTATFPAGLFSAPPMVFTQAYESQQGYAMVKSVSAASAVLTIRSVDGANSSVIGRIYWMAMGV